MICFQIMQLLLGIRILFRETEVDNFYGGRVKKRKFFMRPLLMNTTVVIVHKKVYNSPFPIRKLLWNPMRQLENWSIWEFWNDKVHIKALYMF